ncbi:MAG: NAD-dependent deacylase [Syntrophales bacterium]|jgi:NAD-dependent deacetylase
MEEVLIDQVKRVSDWVIGSRKTVVFTGAGISTESGIPDFRSPGGIWSRFDPEDFTIQRFLASPEVRRKQWQILLEGGLLIDAEPNRAHYAISELEKIGKVACIITQNIDNLHQRAGNTPENVYELHGNMKWLRCLDCDNRYPLEDIVQRHAKQADAPVCERCKGILKPDAVYFGEALPEQVLRMATMHASDCELMIAIGTSLVVYPAAYMPSYAKSGGAKLVIINNAPTPYDKMADMVIRTGAGDAMSGILSEVKRMLS